MTGELAGRRRAFAVGVFAAVMLVATSIPGGAFSAARADHAPGLEATDLDKIGPDGSVFGKAEYVAAFRGGFPGAFAYFAAPPDRQAAADPCLTKSAYCHLYKVTVSETGAGGTLRVAIDSSKRGECFGLELRDPDGVRAPDPDGGFPHVCPEFAGTFQAFNIDISVAGAMAGVWEIRVLGAEVEDWAYRVRAFLDGTPRAEPHLLAPNLTPWLPSEFGFVAPASANPGTEMDRKNPPGPPGTSCHAQDSPEDEPNKHARCLRFSAGLYNTGDGPLHVKFVDDDVNDTHKAFQHVYYRDQSPGDYPNEEALVIEAGEGEYHAYHAHRHFKDMVLYQLFSVSADSVPPPYQQGKVLTEVGKGDKHGYCTFSQRMERWSGFQQDGQFAAGGNCNTTMALERGWGDIYRWQRPGQFVPYDDVADADGTMKAGLYVVRITVDPEDLLLETKESDNTGYAYIRVVDGQLPHTDSVIVCEQGYGKSPWDPTKKVVEDSFSWAGSKSVLNLPDPDDC